jgi:hypothetical protein
LKRQERAVTVVESYSFRGRSVSLNVGEVTGALGDTVTVLPVVVALAALTEASLAHLFVGFAVFQAVWGLYYGLPLSVEPMKALAGLAIAGALTYGELMGAGLAAGAVLLVAARLNAIDRVAEYVAEPVIRGVQLSVAALLAVAGVDLAAGAPRVAALGVGVAVVGTLLHQKAGALAVLGAGTAVAALAGVPAPTVPTLGLFPVGDPALSLAVGKGLVGQLAMTVGNAAVATALLCDELFDADVSPDELAGSMGAMNLLAVPLGGAPMCHGSGGLVGKHAFGARTGGANLVLAGLYLLAALVAPLWTGFPMAMLGVLLLAVAAHLARVASTTDDRALAAGMAVVAVLANVGVAFLAGVVAERLLARVRSTAA